MSGSRKLFLFIALPLVVVFLGVVLLASRNKTAKVTSDSTAESNNTAVSSCTNLSLPTDISKVTSVLYPGQVRGGDYKPHGGLRVDNASSNDLIVTAPLAATVTQGSRYIEQGETQYMFDFKTDCGLEYRLDHLKTLSAKLQAAAEQLPAAMPDDSRTNPIKNVTVTKGETIATAVGFAKGPEGKPNVSFDFGVYNMKQKNSAASDASWVAVHKEDGDQAIYATCWLDLLPTAEATTLKNLPAGDSTAGKTSDYCE